MSLPHILLGLLKLEGASSGYDLKGCIDGKISNFWYCDLSQIYRALNTCEEQGWVTSEADKPNPHNRKIYHLTATGETALKTWLAEDFEYTPPRMPMLARLFFGTFGDLQRIRQQLIAYRQYHTELYSRYRAIETLLESLYAENPAHQPYWMITLQHGLFISDACIKWCNDALDRLDREEQENA